MADRPTSPEPPDQRNRSPFDGLLGTPQKGSASYHRTERMSATTSPSGDFGRVRLQAVSARRPTSARRRHQASGGPPLGQPAPLGPVPQS